MRFRFRLRAKCPRLSLNCPCQPAESLTIAHADLVELASDTDLLNLVETDEHEQRLTQTRGVIEAHRWHAVRLREGEICVRTEPR